MNKAILTGRITKDVELRTTQNGIANVVFTLAVNRGYKDANGNYPADFINCVAWRQQAEYMANYVKKGYLLAVEGQIQVRTYQNQHGQTVYVTEVMCESVENLTPREQTATQPQPTATTNSYDDDGTLPF